MCPNRGQNGADAGDEAGTKSTPAAAEKPHKSAPLIYHPPEVRKAKPVQHTIPKATLVSPGVQKFHSQSPAPLPARKGVPLQRFNQGNDGNG